MPFKFYCDNCGALLIETEDLHIIVYQSTRHYKNRKRPIPMSEYIERKIGNHCPKCGHKLSMLPQKVEVTIKGAKHDQI